MSGSTRDVVVHNGRVDEGIALLEKCWSSTATERKTTMRDRRRLAPVLWRTASGDDTYHHILTGILHPASLWLILTGGLLVTVRNQLTERLFGLDWRGVGRYSTGVPLEDVERKRRELFALQGAEPPSRAPDMERMYTIRIRAGKDAVLKQLGAFGDPDRQYLKPRFVHIRRTAGDANQVGTTIRYDVPLLRMSFGVALERVVPGRYLLYRILDGMGRGGILAFVTDEMKPGVSLLTIYVGFDFPRVRGLGRLGWWFGRRLLPQFAHDVVWNHSLCEIKRLAELDEQAGAG
jgi:hypothetical protein